MTYWLMAIAVFAVLCMGAGVYVVARSPLFWSALVGQVVAAAIPVLRDYAVKPMTPDEQAQWREAERAGRGDEFMRKRRGAPPKG